MVGATGAWRRSSGVAGSCATDPRALNGRDPSLSLDHGHGLIRQPTQWHYSPSATARLAHHHGRAIPGLLTCHETVIMLEVVDEILPVQLLLLAVLVVSRAAVYVAVLARTGVRVGRLALIGVRV